MKRRMQQKEEALQCGCPDNSNVAGVDCAESTTGGSHERSLFFFLTCFTRVSSYSTRKTDTAPSKRDKATATHRRLVFKYILRYIRVRILKLSLL